MDKRSSLKFQRTVLPLLAFSRICLQKVSLNAVAVVIKKGFCNHVCCLGIPVLLLTGVVCVMLWIKGKDPFVRIEFTIKAANGEKTKGLAVLNKPVGKHPIVLYLHGSSGRTMHDGRILRTLAEQGLAAISFDYNQTNYALFKEEMLALTTYVQSQPWALSNSISWISYSLGAQLSLRFALQHPESRPRMMVNLAGGWVRELREDNSAKINRGMFEQGIEKHGSIPSFCSLLLIRGELDQVFPQTDFEQVADKLQTMGFKVRTVVVSNAAHGFGVDRPALTRMIAEHIARAAPPPDLNPMPPGSWVTAAQAQGFDSAMQHAGRNRRELWKAVQRLKPPERLTAMAVVGNLDDYDLANLTADHLFEIVTSAWRLRRMYPWCANAPQEVFDRFVANPRIYEEPIERWQQPLRQALTHVVKYSRTTQEAADAVWNWMRAEAITFKEPHTYDSTPMTILRRRSGGCFNVVLLYTALGRSIGLPTRPVWTMWPTIGSPHYWTEVWDTERRSWHAFDTSALDRSYAADWFLRVPKSVAMAASGERGGWNALAEHRFEALTNTINRTYPSGFLTVQVKNSGIPLPSQKVSIHIWLGGRAKSTREGSLRFTNPEVLKVASAATDVFGEVHFDLGESALYPYRIFLDDTTDGDWQWLAVQAGHRYSVVLVKQRSKPYDVTEEPPPLHFRRF
jgi:dienelactone hydrolase